MKINNFQGVFMRDTLPKIVNHKECFVMNLDSNDNNGTHWVCLYKNNNKKYYFDSYGLDPPIEVITYLGENIKCSTFELQKDNHICGHLCLFVLNELSNGISFEDVIFSLFKL